MHRSDETPADRTRRLEQIAHRIWVEEGRPHGRDREHWAAAEAELDALDAANRSVPGTGQAPGPGDGPYEAGPPAGTGTRRRQAVAKTGRTRGGTDAAPKPTADGPKKAGTKPASRSRAPRPAGDA
jgi:hypothetical protein